VLILLLTGSSWAWSALDVIKYQLQEMVIDDESYQVRIPVGYKLELLTDALDGPRLFAFDAQANLIIGSESGKVYRLAPPYTRAEVLLYIGNYPHSVAFRKNEIFIARTRGLYVASYKPGQKKIPTNDVRLVAALPGGGGHNSRTVAVGPDHRVYISLGISGNCSDEYVGESYPFDRRRGGVLVLDESRARPVWEVYASGLRNPVGFDWHPKTGVMYASNNGPDHHGFEQPPEYFSRLEKASFHGMPWFQYDGKSLQRDSCVDSPSPLPVNRVIKPEAVFAARNAPMAVSFVNSGAMDPRFEYAAVVALHGSWGTQPSGGFMGNNATRRHPKLVVVRFEGNRAKSVEDLITGFQLKSGERWARPVGVGIGPDGAVYFTSDAGINGLFRLKYTGRH
jgi:glucose/arabinose dehydrogenase